MSTLHMYQHTFLVLLILCVTCTNALQPAGLQLGLSQHGLDMAARVAVDQLTAKLKGLHIKDQHGEAHVVVGKVEYDITNIVIESFTKPTSQVTVSPGAGLTWAVSGAGIGLHGHWAYKYKLGFIRIRDSGSLDVSGSGINFRISVKMGVDKGGRPTIYTTGCSSGIGDLHVKFHGGASWLYNIFDHQIARALKGKLNDVLCSAAKEGINEDAEKKLAELKVVTNIGKQMSLDYRLVESPVFSKGIIQSRHKGEITWKTDPKPYPVKPIPFPAVTAMPRMVYIFASEYVVNSLAFTAYTHGLVRYNLTSDEMPKGDGGFLNTTCNKFGTACIGDVLYKVAKKYPNSSIRIQMETARAPFVHVTPKGVNLTFVGDMIFRAKTPQQKIVYLFKMSVAVNMSVRARLDDHTVTAAVASFVPKVKVVDSRVGNISDANMQMVFKIAADEFIVKKLNELGKKGIDIPNIPDVKFVKPKMQFYDGSLMFATDLLWSPKHLEHIGQKNVAHWYHGGDPEKL